MKKVKLFESGALLIDDFNDFVSIVRANEDHATFNQIRRYVEETDDAFTFRYNDKYYSYECDVPKKDILNIDDFKTRYVRTATKATKRKIEVDLGS